MAPKRAAKSSAPPPPPPPPPPAESSEETDSRSRSEESEDEETTAVSLTPVSKKNPPAPAQKGEESETSDEEEEEEEPARAAPPSAPKNLPPPPPRQGGESDTSDEEEEEGESESDEEAPPTKPAPEQKAEDMKPLSSGEAKKPAMPSRRGWSPDDEVRILEALAAHRRQHGKLPRADALVAALAGSLDNRAAGSKELMSKVRCLRERYVNDAKKREIPSKEHDRRRFDLSKIVWGGDKALPPAPAPAPTPASALATKANVHAPREFGDMCEMYPYIAEEVKQLDVAHPGLFKRPFGRIDNDKACKLDLKIKKQRVAQVRVEQRRGDLAKEVIRTLLELIQ